MQLKQRTISWRKKFEIIPKHEVLELFIVQEVNGYFSGAIIFLEKQPSHTSNLESIFKPVTKSFRGLTEIEIFVDAKSWISNKFGNEYELIQTEMIHFR